MSQPVPLEDRIDTFVAIINSMSGLPPKPRRRGIRNALVALMAMTYDKGFSDGSNSEIRTVSVGFKPVDLPDDEDLGAEDELFEVTTTEAEEADEPTIDGLPLKDVGTPTPHPKKKGFPKKTDDEFGQFDERLV